MAEALGIAASILTVIDITNRVLSFCRNYAAAAKGAPWELSKLTTELKSLSRTLDSIKELHSSHGIDAEGPLAEAVIAYCREGGLITKELKGLEKKLGVPNWIEQGSRGAAFLQALKWPLKEKEVKKILDSIERWKSSLDLALTASHRFVVRMCGSWH